VLAPGAALAVVLVAAGLLLGRLAGGRVRWSSLPAALRPVCTGVALALVLAYAVLAGPPVQRRFLYFQF
jgi:hypothetical protein